MEFQVREAGGQRNLTIKILGKEFGNEWLRCLADFNYKGVNAKLEFSLMLGEFYSFLDQVKTLNRSLQGQAVFVNIEDNVHLAYSTDGLGHIYIEGYLRDASDKVKIIFSLQSDQTFLPILIDECEQIKEDLRKH